MHLPTSQQMQVQVKHALARVGAGIQNEAEAASLQSLSRCQPLGDE
jgi:hypothetical protein